MDRVALDTRYHNAGFIDGEHMAKRPSITPRAIAMHVSSPVQGDAITKLSLTAIHRQ